MLSPRRILMFFFALAYVCLNARGLLAQQVQVLNISSGPQDVLYAQSELLQSIDEAWFAPLSPAFSATTPIDSPSALTVPPLPPANTRANDSSIRPNPKDQQKEESTRFRWKPALGESLLFTGIMHTFNLTTEAGTRDALNGQLIHALHRLRVGIARLER